MRNWTPFKMNQRCPVCGHGGWCVFKGPIGNPVSVACARVSDGCAKNKFGVPITFRGGMGWIHDIRKDPNFTPRSRPIAINKIQPRVHPFIGDLAKEFHQNASASDITMLGGMLGISAASLTRLKVGWCKQYQFTPIDPKTGELLEPQTVGAQAWTFPMRDGKRRVIGVRFRNPDGQKWAAKGSMNGLFIPDSLTGKGPLLIVEGPTETGSALDLGFDAIGRPGNTSGREHAVQFCAGQKTPRDVVIFENNDPPGSLARKLTRDGSDALARELLACKAARTVRVIAPPKAKDLRQWKAMGAKASDIAIRINQTPLWRPRSK